MADLSIYKVNLDTPQPNGKQGESPRNAFTKYNSLVDKLDDKYLDKDNNLSELSSKSSARTNLGLGTAATKDYGNSLNDVQLVGAFGLGRSGPTLEKDANSYTDVTSVFHGYDVLNSPPGQGWSILNLARTGERMAQLALRTDTSLRTSIAYVRMSGNLAGDRDNWGPWFRIFTDEDVGTSGEKIFYADDFMEVASKVGTRITIGSDAGNNLGSTAYSATLIGGDAGKENVSGEFMTAVGREALRASQTGNRATAIGYRALYSVDGFDNITGLGFNSHVTGSNQVQLGASGTTTYAYGSVQDRSDIRDKTDIRDTQLGLTFVNALRPVDYRWDMREDYRPDEPEYPAEPQLEDFMPAPVDEASFGDNEQALEAALQAYEQDKQQAELDYEQAHDAWKLACKPIREQWLEDCKLENIEHDGTHKRNRYHHGLIAQEVKDVLDNLGVDFGGYQDHSINGGDDVLSIGYQELIAPMIKAIQELSARVEQLEGQNE